MKRFLVIGAVLLATSMGNVMAGDWQYVGVNHYGNLMFYDANTVGKAENNVIVTITKIVTPSGDIYKDYIILDKKNNIAEFLGENGEFFKNPKKIELSGNLLELYTLLDKKYKDSHVKTQKPISGI